MEAHLRILSEEPKDGYDAHGLVYLGETETGEIVVDCCRDPSDSSLPGQLYRKNRNVGGKFVHRIERASGSRKAAIQKEHRFLGEPGT